MKFFLVFPMSPRKRYKRVLDIIPRFLFKYFPFNYFDQPLPETNYGFQNYVVD